MIYCNIIYIIYSVINININIYIYICNTNNNTVQYNIVYVLAVNRMWLPPALLSESLGSVLVDIPANSHAAVTRQEVVL